jgi:hypothetical protein
MHTKRFEWKARAMLFLVTSVALAGACIAIEHAHFPRYVVAIAESRSLNATTGLQSIEPIHCASITRGPRLAGKSRIGIWIKSEHRA